MAQVTHDRRPLRRGQQRIVGGVCAGLAATLDVDPTLVRIAFVLLAFANGLGVLVYLLLWILVPEEGREGPWTVRAAAGSVGQDVSRMGADVKAALQPASRSPQAAPSAPPAAAPADPSPPSPTSLPSPMTGVAPAAPAAPRSMWPGVLLVVVGALLLAGNLGWLWWTWAIGAPVLLIAAGIWLLARRTR